MPRAQQALPDPEGPTDNVDPFARGKTLNLTRVVQLPDGSLRIDLAKATLIGDSLDRARAGNHGIGMTTRWRLQDM